MEITLVPTEKLDSFQAELHGIKKLLEDQKKQADLNLWLSKKEARVRLKVCQKTLDNYLSKRVLPFSRFAGKIYIKAADIEAHLQRNYITK